MKVYAVCHQLEKGNPIEDLWWIDSIWSDKNLAVAEIGRTGFEPYMRDDEDGIYRWLRKGARCDTAAFVLDYELDKPFC